MAFCTSFCAVFFLYIRSICVVTNRGYLCRCVLGLGTHFFISGENFLRNKIVTALLERILELTGENALTLKQSVDEDGNVTVTITVAIKED